MRAKSSGRPPADDGQMVGGGPQVLADGDDVHSYCLQVGQHSEHLVLALAEPEHQARLRREPGAIARAKTARLRA